MSYTVVVPKIQWQRTQNTKKQDFYTQVSFNGRERK